MKKIVALTDYQGRFGSKYFEKVYRSGFDKTLLKDVFADYGFDLEFLPMSDPDLFDKVKGKKVIYTSQEDPGYEYKSFIEDVVLSLEDKGIVVIPQFKYLRANNNKVYMEMLRERILPSKYHLETMCFGTAEEAMTALGRLKFPLVIKTAAGASSSGVRLISDRTSYERVIKKLSRSKYIMAEMRDIARAIKHKRYVRESLYRKKFIVQEFVQGLNNDWKVLVYNNKYYVLRRSNRPGDFRASGSGIFEFDEKVNPLLLEAAKEIKETFDVPMISVDLALSGERVILIEFQFVYFGTSTLEKSPYYSTYSNGEWMQIPGKSILEKEYASAIVQYIESHL